MLLSLSKIDHRASIALHSIVKKNDFLHTVFVVFARWIFWILLLSVGGFVFWHKDPLFVEMLSRLIGLSLLFGVALNLILGKIFVRKRPYYTHRLHALIETHWLGGSFPSDHSMLSFVIATPLWIFEPSLGIVAITIAGLIAISRVGVGVHYVSDILVGSAVGISVSFFAFLMV